MEKGGALQVQKGGARRLHIPVLPQIQRQILGGEVPVLLQLQVLELAVEISLDAGAAHPVGQHADGGADLGAGHRPGDGREAAAAQTGHRRVPQIPEGGAAGAAQGGKGPGQPHRLDDLGGGDAGTALPLVQGDAGEVALGGPAARALLQTLPQQGVIGGRPVARAVARPG